MNGFRDLNGTAFELNSGDYSETMAKAGKSGKAYAAGADDFDGPLFLRKECQYMLDCLAIKFTQNPKEDPPALDEVLRLVQQLVGLNTI